MAGRTRLPAYFIITFFYATFFYPIMVHSNPETQLNSNPETRIRNPRMVDLNPGTPRPTPLLLPDHGTFKPLIMVHSNPETKESTLRTRDW